MDLWLTFPVSQLALPFNHFGHFTANVVWVPHAFIGYWLKSKCLRGIQRAAMTPLNHPCDEVFCRWLVVCVSLWLWGLKLTVCCWGLCICYSIKKNMLFFLYYCCCFFRLQPIAAQLGSSLLLPWQLPVNIPAEFPRWRWESTAFLLQKINWTFLQKISKLCVVVEVGTAPPYLYMFESMVRSFKAS